MINYNKIYCIYLSIVLEVLKGRRIVDIEYFITQIQKRHEGGFGCSFIDMEYQNEIIQGYNQFYISNVKCVI